MIDGYTLEGAARLVVLALATYYVAVTLTRLDGPLGIAGALRERMHRWRRRALIGPGEPAYYDLDRIDADWMVGGLECPVCAAPYALALVLALELLPVVGPAAAPALAACGLVALLWYAQDRG